MKNILWAILIFTSAIATQQEVKRSNKPVEVLRNFTLRYFAIKWKTLKIQNDQNDTDGIFESRMLKVNMSEIIQHKSVSSSVIAIVFLQDVWNLTLSSGAKFSRKFYFFNPNHIKNAMTFKPKNHSRTAWICSPLKYIPIDGEIKVWQAIYHSGNASAAK